MESGIDRIGTLPEKPSDLELEYRKSLFGALIAYLRITRSEDGTYGITSSKDFDPKPTRRKINQVNELLNLLPQGQRMFWKPQA